MKRILIPLIMLVIIGFISGSFLFLKDKEKVEVKDDARPTIQEEDKQMATLTFVGDLLFETNYYNAINSGEDKEQYFHLVKNYFLKDDLSIGNMEVVIGSEDMPVKGGDNYNFSAPIWVGDLVSSLDFEVLSTANNHAYDQGSAGVISTIDYFKNHTDILTVGTYKTREDTTKQHILEINGIRFGLIAYAMGTNVKMEKDKEYMVSLYKQSGSNSVTAEDKARMKEEIESLNRNVDVTILLMHWGSEYTFEPNETQKELAHFFNSLGVDIIVGNHSHNIQPIEWILGENKTLVYYSLGNFVSADEYIERTNETFNNAYQIGLLSNLVVTKENNHITIDNITTEPIINYYDKNLRNFTLVPYSLYDEEYETTHYRYNLGLSKEFITNTYEAVIPECFR